MLSIGKIDSQQFERIIYIGKPRYFDSAQRDIAECILRPGKVVDAHKA